MWTKWLLDLHTMNSMWWVNMNDPKPCNNDFCIPDTAACHSPYDSICLAQWMKQYNKERQKNTPALSSSKWKVNYIKVFGSCTSSLCAEQVHMARYLQKIKFHCPIKMGYPMQNLNDNQSAWSISMGTLRSIYGESARKRTQTKTGKDSVLSSTKILQQE